MRPVTPILLAALLAPSLAAQGVVHFVPDEGENVVRAGDFDGDGVEDFLVRAWYGAFVRSGADGSLLLEPPSNSQYGTLCGPDLDHDGTPDLVLGDVGAADPNGVGTGSVTAISGASGVTLWTAYGSAQADSFGFVVGDAGDANADGTPDVLVDAWQYDPPFGGGPGYVRLLSGVDGSVLREWAGATGYATFGVSLGTIGDYDGDGHDDSLVTDLDPNGGVVNLYSGATGGLLKVFDPPVDGTFGAQFTAEHDLDGDGVRDLVASAPGWLGWTGRVLALSGADSSVLFDLQGTEPNGILGGDVDVLDDLDGDGVPEILTCGNDTALLTGEASFVLIASGADGTILLAMPTQSLANSFAHSPLAALGDLDGDGVPEFAVSGVDTFVLTPLTPSVEPYCPAKASSLGCLPTTTSSGAPSLTGPDAFRVACSGLDGQARGALMWSASHADRPFLGGTLCLAAPWLPLGSFAADGTCQGSAEVDVPADLLPYTGLEAGDVLYLQVYYRDPQHPDGSGLAFGDGVRIMLLP